MFLNIKNCFSALLFLPALAFAQKENAVEQENVFLQVHFGAPSASGNNFLANGYSQNTSLALTLARVFNNNFYAGLNYEYTGLSDINEAVVGPIDSAKHIRFNAVGGYYFINSKELLADASVLLGFTTIRNLKGGTAFRDSGFGASIQIGAGYKISSQWVLYVATNQRFDFFNIEAPSETGTFFKRGSTFTPLIGIRIRFI